MSFGPLPSRLAGGGNERDEFYVPAGSAPPPAPQLEQFDTGTLTVTAISFDGGVLRRESLTPDPLPAFKKLKQAGVAFGLSDFFDRLGTIVMAGGATRGYGIRGNQEEVSVTVTPNISTAKIEVAEQPR